MLANRNPFALRELAAQLIRGTPVKQTATQAAPQQLLQTQAPQQTPLVAQAPTRTYFQPQGNRTNPKGIGEAIGFLAQDASDIVMQRRKEEAEQERAKQLGDVLLKSGIDPDIARLAQAMPEMRGALLAQALKGKEPEQFGSPQEMTGPDGNPVVVQIGDRGTVRPLDGYTPYQKGSTPKEIALYQAAQNDPEFAKFLEQSGNSNLPASIVEYQKFKEMTPAEQTQYLILKRANPYVDMGDVKVIPNPAVPGQNLAVSPKGIAPERTVKDDRVVTLPAVPGGSTQATPPQGEAAVTPQPALPPDETVATPQPNLPAEPVVQELPPTREEREKAAELEEKAVGRQAQKETQGSIVSQDISRALDMLKSDTPVAGLVGSAVSLVPGTPAHDFSNLLDTVKSNIGFDKLQAMREASPTGGALGSVSERENTLLQSTYGALAQSQSPKELEFNLKRLHNVYNDIIHGSGNGPERYALEQAQKAKPNVAAPPPGFQVIK